MAKPRKIFEIGKEYGHLTVLGEAPKRNDGHIQWHVRCRCGKEYDVLTGFLSKPNCKCLECSRKEPNIRTLPYVPGYIINGWEIISETDPNIRGIRQYICRCLKCGCTSVRTIGSMKNRKGTICIHCVPDYNFRYDGDTAIGTLPDGTEFLIDANMVEEVARYHWGVSRKGYIECTNNNRPYSKLHCLVLRHPYSQTIFIDHINRKKTDCRTVNLRLVNAQQNAMNKSLSKNNTTGYVGVCYNPKVQRYNARIFLNERAIYLGSSKDPIECAQMYNIASELLFKEYGGYKNDVGAPTAHLQQHVMNKCAPFLMESFIATRAVS